MAKRIITEHTYIFYCDGVYFEQNTFGSDEDAIKHADFESKERGKPVKVARWLEKDTLNDNQSLDIELVKQFLLTDLSNGKAASIVNIEGAEKWGDHIRIYTQSEHQRENGVCTMYKVQISEEVEIRPVKLRRRI